MKTKMYVGATSTGSAARWAIEELGVPFEVVRLDRADKKKPEFLAINPHGTVPALNDDGAYVFETLAIVVYLGVKYGVERGLWPRSGSLAYANALSWASWSAVTFEPTTFEYAMHSSDAHYALPKEERSAAVADAALRQIRKYLGALDQHIQEDGFVVGNEFSLADVLVCAPVARARACQIDLGEFSRLASWFERCARRPHAGVLANGIG